MKTIRNEKLFQELKTCPDWGTLFSDREGTLKDLRIPTLAGGLDRITVTKSYVTFYDSGCNGRDNSFRIGGGK